MKQNKILKFGHRGAKAYVAENTLESVLKALELGVDGIEIDVHKCKSEELVVFHDFTLDRLTNAKGEISNFNLTELKQLQISNTYKIPTLIEVLDLVNNSCIVNIELKGKNTAFKTVAIIEDYIKNKNWNYNNIIISSFNFEELLSVYKINKKIPLGVLIESNLESAITFAKSINAVAIHPDYNMLTKSNVKKIQNNGFKVNTWTVNTVKDIEKIKSYNVNAIISDFPDRL